MWFVKIFTNIQNYSYKAGVRIEISVSKWRKKGLKDNFDTILVKNDKKWYFFDK